MDTPALQRCYRAVPLSHVRDLAPTKGVVALRCTKTGCIACADFMTDGREAYEERFRGEESHATIRAWNCDVPEMRTLARQAVVTSIPAYILVRANGDVSVRTVS